MAKRSSGKQSKAKKPASKPIESYDHKDQKRANNPPVGLVTPDTDPDAGQKKTYQYDPHLDPQLVWAGKAEHTSFEVPTVSLHVHERIDPRTIIEAVRKRNGNGGNGQMLLFEQPTENPPLREAIEFYKHAHNWTNRLIAGDSLLVMNSLLEKEGMAGKVQMVYIDPPYGIRYGSNFQPFVNKRDVKDGNDEDLTQEPEMIRAFRDTWELGIHSYLTYLRDRLLLSRELLHESGSCFVQIGDENVHHVRELTDEVFGPENFQAQVNFKATSALGQKGLGQAYDYILWYARRGDAMKFRPIFRTRDISGDREWKFVDDAAAPEGPRTLSQAEFLALTDHSGVFRRSKLTSSGFTQTCIYTFELHGVACKPFGGKSWLTTQEGMRRLIHANRLFLLGGSPYFKQYFRDFPVVKYDNSWSDQPAPESRRYVVETATKFIHRCMLMTTDPGDLVFDPTCCRAGTRVMMGLCAAVDGERTPLNPPVNGGRGTPLGPPVNGGKMAPSPLAGRVGVGFIPIEQITPGDWVYAHDGRPHRVRRVLVRNHSGTMLGIRREGCDKVLWITTDHLILSNRRVPALSEHGKWRDIPGEHFARARQMRREMSPPERKLWQRLRGEQLGVKFRRQHPIGPYIADFYSRDAAMVLEVDGEQHFDGGQAEAGDRRRDAYMETTGLRVLRFPADRVGNDMESVVTEIHHYARERVLEEDDEKQWRYAEELKVGDVVYEATPLYPPASGGKIVASGGSDDSLPACGEGWGGVSSAVRGSRRSCREPNDTRPRLAELHPHRIVAIERQQTREEVYDLEIDEAHSFLTDVCAVHNCGSGTTAYVAEQWGRRWITCDTSRVSIALAKQRLMTALYDYYELAHPDEGVGSGFSYKTVPHITLKSIANNPEIKEGMSRKQIDAAIAKYADQETLYDQPYIDNKRARVSGPFTVEAVPAPAVRSIVEVTSAGPGDPRRDRLPLTSRSEVKGEGAGQEPLADTRGSVQDARGSVTADASVGRSGESLRQDEWRGELLKCGIRGKSGQRVEFSRVEALPGTRWLHADAETKPTEEPSRRPSPSKGEGAVRVVVSFGPQHAPLEQRQVEQALEEAQLLVPKPNMVVFASFQFDPEAAKDIDETNWPGITLLKVQMNTDLLTDDLKKKRASNESFWMIGQPDVVVNSEQWIVNSRKEALGPYAVIAELSGAHSLAEVNGLGRDDLSVLLAFAQRRDLWAAVATDPGGGVDSCEHRRGPGAARDGGVSSLSGHRARLPGRIGDAGDFVRELAALPAPDRAKRIERLRGSREIVDRAREVSSGLTGKLSTIHYSQVTILGFDYYNPITGKIESGDTSKIAMWMLDTDYDGRSLYPRQVFFPMAGPKDAWARLAKNLKAEIDEELIEAYRGTVSLPFEPGDHRRVAVKIIDDRGIESLKIVEVG